jgi:hypothetical protein
MVFLVLGVLLCNLIVLWIAGGIDVHYQVSGKQLSVEPDPIRGAWHGAETRKNYFLRDEPLYHQL